MASISFSIFIYFLFLFLLLFKSKKGKHDNKEYFFYAFNNLRGLFALEIIVGHVVRYESTLLYPMGKFMIISVAYFFFVSAFGLVRSFHQKENYLYRFLIRKCPYLVMIASITFFIRTLLFICLNADNSGQNIFWLLIRQINWYIYELLLFYILFYFVYKYLRKYRITVITMVTLIFITYAYYSGMIEAYYASALAFPAGLLFYEHFESISNFLSSVWGKVFVILITVVGLSSLLLDSDSLIGMVYLRNIICIAGLCILFYFLTYFTVGNNLLKILGKYSTELYLYQFIFLDLTVSLTDYRIRMCLVCGLTGLTAIVICPLNQAIRRWLEKLSSANS